MNTPFSKHSYLNLIHLIGLWTTSVVLFRGENGTDIFRWYSRTNRLEGFKYVRIRVWIFNIWYRIHIHIQIFKSHIYANDIHSYIIRHGWHYLYSNLNPDRNTKTNVISMISVCIRSVFIQRTNNIFLS
jgi:hypothetical protein